ncbi:DUF4199 domain-containing protein [Flavobacterium crassostreae]|uniref:DUF4199 domain-containing protein n=1 Tax=Flavobacterium crassostreae TaxID=1763534 RepID=A0A1B9E7I8_9FLAO|nr:DUF4199 domain-containing protein [Flavobacterium crassostreae]OCB77914.1 hypothetical protein LPBF_02905 [Flavobacterium crassostreae]
MVNEIVKKNGVSFGIITGVLSVLITTFIYVVDLKLFTSTWIGFASIAVYLVVGIILLIKTKKDLNGLFSFKDAFTTYFISAVIGILISVAFNIILFNFIDPAAKEIIKENTLKYLIATLQKFNTPTTAINEAITKLKENDQFSIPELLKGSVFSILFSALFGLILAAFFKSKSLSRES